MATEPKLFGADNDFSKRVEIGGLTGEHHAPKARPTFEERDWVLAIQKLLNLSGEVVEITGKRDDRLDTVITTLRDKALEELTPMSSGKQELVESLLGLLSRANSLPDCDITDEEQKDVVELFTEILDKDE